MDLIRKEIEETKRVEEIRASRRAAMTERSRQYERKLSHIRQKQFEDELARSERSAQLARSNETYVSRRSLSRDMVREEREHANEMRRYYVDRFREAMNEQLRRVESMETVCRDRVEMLRERMRDEKENWRLREQASVDYVNRMRNEYGTRVQANMRNVQDTLYRGVRAFRL